MTVVSAVPLLGVMVAVAHFVLPVSIPWSLILLIGISDLLFIRISDVAAQAFQAVDQMRYTAKLSLLPNLLRLIGAAIVFFWWHRATALCWGWFYLGSTSICGVVAIVLTNYKLGLPKLALWRIRHELVEGFYFSTSLSAQTVYNDIDKMMLARLSTLDATGIYAAAYRLIDVAFAPVRSILYAAYPEFLPPRTGGHCQQLCLRETHPAQGHGIFGVGVLGAFCRSAHSSETHRQRIRQDGRSTTLADVIASTEDDSLLLFGCADRGRVSRSADRLPDWRSGNQRGPQFLADTCLFMAGSGLGEHCIRRIADSGCRHGHVCALSKID